MCARRAHDTRAAGLHAELSSKARPGVVHRKLRGITRYTLNNSEADGMTLLMSAVVHGRVKCLRVLLRARADPNHRGGHTGETALMAACRNAKGDCIRELLKFGACVLTADECGMTSVAHAAHGGDEPSRALLEQPGAAEAVRAADNSGRTPLHHAALADDPEVVELLMRKGAVPGALSNQGLTATQVAAAADSCRALRRLIAIVPPAAWGHVVHCAAMHNSISALHVLLPICDKEEPLPSGCRPLHTAAWFGHTGAAEVLLDAGAAVDPADDIGRTPLHRCCRSLSRPMIALLIHRGADPMVRDATGAAPLHLLARNPDGAQLAL